MGMFAVRFLTHQPCFAKFHIDEPRLKCRFFNADNILDLRMVGDIFVALRKYSLLLMWFLKIKKNLYTLKVAQKRRIL